MMWEKVKRLQGPRNRDLLRSAPNPATEAHKPRCGLHQLQDFYPETVAKILVSGGKTTFLLKSNEFPIEVSDHSNIPGLLSELQNVNFFTRIISVQLNLPQEKARKSQQVFYI